MVIAKSLTGTQHRVLKPLCSDTSQGYDAKSPFGGNDLVSTALRAYWRPRRAPASNNQSLRELARVRSKFESQVGHSSQITTLTTDQKQTSIFFLTLTKTSNFILHRKRSYELRLHLQTIAIFKKELIKITFYFQNCVPNVI